MNKGIAFFIILINMFLLLAGLNLFLPNAVYANWIYHENLIYFGGISFDLLKLRIDKQRKLYYRDKLFILNIKDDNKTKLLVRMDSKVTSIRSYEINTKEYIAIASGGISRKESKYESNLTILNKEGKVVKKVVNCIALSKGKYYSWAKNGKGIVYITGETILEGHVPFESSGVWLYDIESGRTKKIANKGVGVNWSWHDNNIYIEDEFEYPSKISVYNLSNGKLQHSEKKGLVFSDDGLYYVSKKVNMGDYRTYSFFIYNNRLNKKIYKFTDDGDFSLKRALYYTFIRKTHYLLAIDLWGYKVFDVDSKKLLIKSDKKVVGWNEDMTKVVVYEGGGKQVFIDDLLGGKRIMAVKIPMP